MNHEGRLIALRHMKGAIVGARLKLLPGPPKENTASHNTLLRQIDGWTLTIKGVERDLKSQSHFNHMLHRAEKGGANGYSANQRLASKEGNVAQLRAALDDVSDALIDLTQTLWDGPNGGARALEGLKTALKNITKHGGDGDDGISFGPATGDLQATIRQLEPHMQDGGAGGMTPVVDYATLILAMFVLIKHVLSRK